MRHSPASRRLVAPASAALFVAAALVSGVAAQSLEDEARAIGRELACPVCEGLSVADSPAPLAAQMREAIRAKLAAGESRERILSYFSERYGEEVLLSPPRSGFTALVWVVPYIGLAAAIGFGVWAVRRGRAAREPEPPQQGALGRYLDEVDRAAERLRDEPLR